MTIFRLLAKLVLMTIGIEIPKSFSREVRFNSTFCRFTSGLRMPRAMNYMINRHITINLDANNIFGEGRDEKGRNIVTDGICDIVQYIRHDG